MTSDIILEDLGGADYDEACALLEQRGFSNLAEGDWSRIFKHPEERSIVRITPYDPAYRLFIETATRHPHVNLPVYGEVIPLQGPGYLVSLPYYDSGNSSERSRFMDQLKGVMGGHSSGNQQLAILAQVLNLGIQLGNKLIPYFAGMDWNSENVVYRGSTPILIDAFYQNGPVITSALRNNEPLALEPEEISAFLKIPFQRKNPI